MRLLVHAVALLVTALSLAACGADASPVAQLAAAIPDEVVARDGVVLREGADGASRLAADLGVEPGDVRATATTGTPALRVLLASSSGITDRLQADGFTPVDGPDGWVVLRRPSGRVGYVGVPAVAVGEGVVAVGDLAQLRGLAAGGPPVPIPPDALDGAVVARLVPGPLDTPSLPPATAAAATADAEGEGRLVLRLADAGSQADAVALSVLLRTAAPRGGDGRPQAEVGAALTQGAVVSVDLEWATDPATALGGGIQESPLGVLRGR